MDLVEIGWGGVGWIGLEQDRDKWRTLDSRVATQLVGCRVVLSSIVLVSWSEGWMGMRKDR
jgi:hypothetical protein